MTQLTSSNKSADIATLAYIWGFPLVTMKRQFNFMTSPDVPPGPGRGPANANNCARSFVNASYTDVVSPNTDTLYCQTQFDLKKEPVVVVVPPIAADRYYTSSSWMHIQTSLITLERVLQDLRVVPTLLLDQTGMDRFLKE